MNRLLFVCFVGVLCLFLAGTILPAAAQSVLVTGTVDAVAPDGSSITVDGQAIATDQQFIDDYFMETGDKVEISADSIDGALTAVSCRYLFDDDEMFTDDEMFPEEVPAEENNVTEEAPETSWQEYEE